MGKKARKTRWRTLEITDEHSDSEESQITNGPRLLPKSFQQKSYYKLPYSSQSTPRRKYQYDSAKSTRSSSTTSENKITFNEDEYTRITTPRQDVLFKKGYLNKPKTYQTQTSTGTSTTSTSNSTGNGTPDHQSTDLDYDSQFVFPNGFVDQNGIYYVNSFEPYPLMLYNPPTYYNEFSNSKSKRYSTGSLTESTSPNNEEVTSQELSGGEASNNVSDYSGHHSVYNMVYPGYYVDGVCPNEDSSDTNRKIKKRRRRKVSKSQTNNQNDSTECSEDEDLTHVEATVVMPSSPVAETNAETVQVNDEKPEEYVEEDPPKQQKYDLKPDAEEFVPRAYRTTPEIPLSPVQYIKVPPNFVQIPIVPFNGQMNPAFIPPGGIPINFIPPDPKLFPPNFVNFAAGPPKGQDVLEKVEESTTNDQNSKVCDTNSNTAKDEPPEKIVTNSKKTIDIATIVSKLEEAAKEQENDDKPVEQSPKKKSFKYKNYYKRNFYNSPRNSPQRQCATDTNEIKHIANVIQTDSDAKFARNNFRKNWKPKDAYKSPKHNVETTHVKKHYADAFKANSNPVENTSIPPSPKIIPNNKVPNQWIPVSSRKKRKNKNFDETDEILTIEEPTQIEEDQQDEFESYDVNMLVDVVPNEKNVEKIINSIAQIEPDNIQIQQIRDIPSVTEIESELITKEEPLKEETTKEEPTEEEPSKEEPSKDEPKKTDDQPDIINNETEIKQLSKKKSKKGAQKPATKRVIITDIDLSDNKHEEVKTPTKKIVKKLDKPKEVIETKQEEPIIKTDTTPEPEEDKKKNKKKKKKASKATGSAACSSTNSNTAEDVYDMLLETTLATEADKTNDEISVELEKMIQKGMYSNLEEKMRSLNINETDGFLKSVFSKVPLTSRPEPVGFLKSPDFTKIPLVKSDPVSEDQTLDRNKTNDELPASESSEIFLENSRLIVNRAEEPKSLYPITEAVKEWMCKTRETTPDVEIFKSPRTIYREFCDSDTNSDTEAGNSRELSASVDDDEITLFTADEIDKTADDNEDLLEYWEDLKIDENKNDEDDIEIYESKYGTNEDYLKLQKEVREKTKTMNHPKNGKLPHRAVCCNIM
ncbi:unnamed protein product [Phyllotreta striolata]|uniref:Uncharacterized protein n=1 Tax=Phyllotreta striolata TaxID=444603 RepID=A0A9N9XQU6_PHYSR|nr:unnamed protein product [Phyllotreta striolata]